MEVKFELSKEECDKLLESSGYVTELVELWYSTWSCYYHGGNVWQEEEIDSLSPIKELVAYRMGDRPKTLDEKYPRLEENKKYKIDNVVNRLFHERLINVIL